MLAGSHDSDTAFPLVGSHCVLLSGCVPPAALSAYSAFLSSLVEVELDDLSRGPVHSAMKQAMSVSSHEATLQAKVASLRTHQFTQAELSNGLLKCECPPYLVCSNWGDLSTYGGHD